jgi:hypothetical protein
MNKESIDKRNYDVASISQPGKSKRANHVQRALEYDFTKVTRPGQFVKIFSNMFKTTGSGKKAYV